MKKALLFSFFTVLTTLCSSQARLVMNNNVWMVIDNGAWVVVENPNPNAVTTMGNGGNISSENEFDRLRWQVGNSTGTYVVPFTPPSGLKTPLTYNITAAGAGPAAASVVFSTYNYGAVAAQWNNNLYRPSDVTHMNNYVTGGVLTPGATNESGHVVDRFWIIDTKATGFAYTTNPTATITYQYDATEVTAGNTITGATPLDYQRFNNTLNAWGDLLFPTCVWTNMGGNLRQVVTPSIPAAQHYRSTTLSDKANPLPIELTDFSAHCVNSQVVISWTTVTEHDNDYFTVEKSLNGIEWTAIGQVDGAGNSVGTINYSFIDPTPTGLAYYRLVQMDFDGEQMITDLVVAGCDAQGGIQIVNLWDDGNDLNVIVNSSFETVHDVTLMDMQGKVMLVKRSQAINNGITHLRLNKESIATGVYLVRLSNSEQVLSERVVLN